MELKRLAIEREIWTLSELSITNRCLLAIIQAKSKASGCCTESNKELATYFSVTPSHMSKMVSALASGGYITIEQKYGNTERHGIRIITLTNKVKGI